MNAARQLVLDLLALLKLCGLDQKAVAAALNISQTLISQWKKGATSVTEAHLDALVVLMKEAIVADFRREGEKRPFLKTSKDRKQAHDHKFYRGEAFDQVRSSLTRWLQETRSEADVEHFRAEREGLRQQLIEALAQNFDVSTDAQLLAMMLKMRQLQDAVRLTRLAGLPDRPESLTRPGHIQLGAYFDDGEPSD